MSRSQSVNHVAKLNRATILVCCLASTATRWLQWVREVPRL